MLIHNESIHKDNTNTQTIEANILANPKLRPPTKEEVELGILVGKHIIIPTIKLLRGRLRRKSVRIRLLYGAVFTFYDSVSIEEYNSLFVKKIKEFKVDKNKLEIDGLTVNYHVRPNIKTVFPVFLEAQYGSRILEGTEEILSMATKIDQTRLFVFPTQEEMSIDGLESFATAFDNFIDKIEICLRREKKLQINLVVKHLILESDDIDFIKKASEITLDEGISLYTSNNKVSMAYTKLGDLLQFIRNLR